ncbi:MAG: CHAP domain-containing protein [Bifidobacterium sp.]|nr:CHAP domain-containing protein [Bifidobacterium sp.]
MIATMVSGTMLPTSANAATIEQAGNEFQDRPVLFADDVAVASASFQAITEQVKADLEESQLQSVSNEGSWSLGDTMQIDVEELVSDAPKEETKAEETKSEDKTEEASPVVEETAEEVVEEAVAEDTATAQSYGRITSTPVTTGDTGNAYPYGQCTWWAYERRKQLGLPVGSFFGNGGMWASSALALGYSVDNAPQAGDIAVFLPGQAGADGYYGHVAIVESVNPDGSIVISEMNVEGLGVQSSRTIDAATASAMQFVH